jgi:hypothetical protein
LIALQINNWNEGRKNKTFEKTMLTEMVKGLETDKSNFQDHLVAYAELNNSVNYFKDLCKKKALFNDTLYPRFWTLNIGKYFQFNKGPYEALKSSGIDRISDDSLRNHLINFFDFKVNIFQSDLEHINRRYRQNVETLLSFRGETYIDSTNSISGGGIPADIFQNSAFMALLFDIDWRVGMAKQCIGEFITRIDALIGQLNNEIEK